jgi:hypothetical protein
MSSPTLTSGCLIWIASTIVFAATKQQSGGQRLSAIVTQVGQFDFVFDLQHSNKSKFCEPQIA